MKSKDTPKSDYAKDVELKGFSSKHTMMKSEGAKKKKRSFASAMMKRLK